MLMKMCSEGDVYVSFQALPEEIPGNYSAAHF